VKTLNNKKFNWSKVAQKPHFITVRYLEEARACLESGAFRMSIVASACALNFGLAFILRRRGLMPNEEKVPNLNTVIKEIREYISDNPGTVLSKIPLDKCDRIRHFRNVFAHPEEYLIMKRSSKHNILTLKPKFDAPKDKGGAYFISSII
jgi:hypothetical protein